MYIAPDNTATFAVFTAIFIITSIAVFFAYKDNDKVIINITEVAETVQTITVDAPSVLIEILKVNINTANAEQLMLIPSIGPIIAERIIEYRKRYGPFKSVYDIQNVGGIGDLTFANIKDYITVEEME